MNHLVPAGWNTQGFACCERPSRASWQNSDWSLCTHSGQLGAGEGSLLGSYCFADADDGNWHLNKAVAEQQQHCFLHRLAAVAENILCVVDEQPSVAAAAVVVAAAAVAVAVFVAVIAAVAAAVVVVVECIAAAVVFYCLRCGDFGVGQADPVAVARAAVQQQLEVKFIQ